jgi:divinyl chlorophyllide a 8-vinyl-reductase
MPLMESQKSKASRVLLFGATGTVGRATLEVLLRRGYRVTCFARPTAQNDGDRTQKAEWRSGDVTSLARLRNDAFCGEKFDAVISCLASRNGDPTDAWAIDHKAHIDILACAKELGMQQFVLLSAICVQKPKLAFQHAKLAFEQKLMASGLTYSIVRPTALFKSLSGQIERLRKGKSFLVFGDGKLTACKPISDHDLANYLVQCLEDSSLQNRILPIGGPGPAITPIEQGEKLFALLGQKPRFKHVPVALMDGIISTLSLLAKFSPAIARKAEFARIGRYYATESMLVYDAQNNRYSAEATPSTGTETLFDHYAALIESNGRISRSEHSVF